LSFDLSRFVFSVSISQQGSTGKTGKPGPEGRQGQKVDAKTWAYLSHRLVISLTHITPNYCWWLKQHYSFIYIHHTKYFNFLFESSGSDWSTWILRRPWRAGLLGDKILTTFLFLTFKKIPVVISIYHYFSSCYKGYTGVPGDRGATGPKVCFHKKAYDGYHSHSTYERD